MGKPNNHKDGGIGGSLKNSLSKLTGKVTLKAPPAKEQPKVQASRPVKPATPKPMAPPQAGAKQAQQAQPQTAPAMTRKSAPQKAAAQPARKPASKNQPVASTSQPAAAAVSSVQASAYTAPTVNSLCEDVVVEGELKFTDHLAFDGRLTGEISSDGDLTLLAKSVVEATISVKSIVVHGKVVGNITASESVHLTSTAVVVGDITTGSLTMEPNSSFQGQGRIGQPSSKAGLDVAPAPAPAKEEAMSSKAA